ncbi:MAG: methyltransferase domain-containing protein [Candidatus Sericytochromatia bacterium]|nr:methyltransferase domain-containing protein [Candidatus Sericytochromatia bacterium]
MTEQPLYELPAIYDQLRTPKGDLRHYQNLAIAADGPVLELGCGSGRLTLGLAVAGVAITGLDRSAAMIAHARIKAADFDTGEYPRWLVGDMTAFRLEGRFALVAITFNALQHLLDNDSVRACFTLAREHLAPGGLMAFDVLNPGPHVLAGASEPYPVDHIRHPETGNPITVLENVTYDRARQLAAISLSFVETDPLGTTVSCHEMVQTLRIFYPLELGELLRQCGWRLIERWGDFGEQPFGADSPRQVCVAEPI